MMMKICIETLAPLFHQVKHVNVNTKSIVMSYNGAVRQ